MLFRTVQVQNLYFANFVVNWCFCLHLLFQFEIPSLSCAGSEVETGGWLVYGVCIAVAQT